MLLADNARVPLHQITVVYINHRGETAVRKILPYRVRWGSNEWHTEPQWLLDGMDVEKNTERTFAIKDMKPAPTHVRVHFKGGEYMDVLREAAKNYIGQADYDRTEEIS